MQNPDLSQWYHHNLNPMAIQWGSINIPWYWLVYVIGWFWCSWAMKKLAMENPHQLDDSAQVDFLLWGWIALILGARITYIVVYNPFYYIEHPDQLLALWNGGMSFHGGFLGVAVTALVIARKYRISLFTLTDPLVIVVPWVIGCGRLANFANGELPGRISTVPWAVVFPPPFDWAPRHPSQLYEALIEGVLIGLIMFFYRRRLLAKPGTATLAFTAFYAVGRFFIEFTREPDPQLGLIWGFSMGQWLCVIMLVGATWGMANCQNSDRK